MRVLVLAVEWVFRNCPSSLQQNYFQRRFIIFIFVIFLFAKFYIYFFLIPDPFNMHFIITLFLLDKFIRRWINISHSTWSYRTVRMLDSFRNDVFVERNCRQLEDFRHARKILWRNYGNACQLNQCWWFQN